MTPVTQKVQKINRVLEAYRKLQREVDRWFTSCLDAGGETLGCRAGCSSCCKALFDITLLDAWLLRKAFVNLPESVQQNVKRLCEPRRDELLTTWPTLQPPYFLNSLPEDEWMEMPEADQTPCPLLDEGGRCLVYASRPLICRLHGLPHVDVSGEDFSGVICSSHAGDPTELPGKVLRWRFRSAFSEEISLSREFANRLTGGRYQELDTFIPLALLAGYELIDWVNLKL